jgi:uncharacterized membrane protein
MMTSTWFYWALLSAVFAAFAVIFLGERPGLEDWLGIALVGAGVVVLALKK